MQAFNKNGDRLCDAARCRKHQHLQHCFGGVFCTRHAGELEVIREQITIFNNMPPSLKNAYTLHLELCARQREQAFRKTTDLVHARIIHDLEEELKRR